MNELLSSLMSAIAALFDGSMGWAIVALALAVRLALLPLTLHLARKMLANAQRIKLLQPQADEIKARLAADPKAMFAEISSLYKRNGAHIIDRSTVLGMLLQWPIFALMYKGISNAAVGATPFLWIRNIASPDTVLAVIVLALTALAAYYAPTATGETAVMMVFVQVLVTALILWKIAAGVGLYWAASASVSVVQTFMLRHEQRRAGVAAAVAS